MNDNTHKPAPEFLEAASHELQVALDGRLQATEHIHLRMASDMVDADSYGTRWLLITDQRLLLVTPAVGPAVGATVIEIALDQVAEVRTTDLVGAAQMELDRKHGGGQEVLHYSRSLVAKFSEAAEAIRRLAKGEPPELPTEMERTRCAKCERLLPEPDGICPFCIRRLDTIKRIAMFLAPQKGKVMLVHGGVTHHERPQSGTAAACQAHR